MYNPNHYDLIKQKFSIKRVTVHLCMSSFFLREIQILEPTQTLISTSNPKALIPQKSIANKFGKLFTFQMFDYKLGNFRYTPFTYKLYKTRCIRLPNCFVQSNRWSFHKNPL